MLDRNTVKHLGSVQLHSAKKDLKGSAHLNLSLDIYIILKFTEIYFKAQLAVDFPIAKNSKDIVCL